MGQREIVQLIIILIGVIFVIFEIIMNLNDVQNDTTNIILYEATQKRLLFIPFAIGAISGHLFLGTSMRVFPCHNIVPFLANELLVILGMLVISLILVLFSKKIKNRSTVFITLLLIAGMLYGHFFWSMNDPENCP